MVKRYKDIKIWTIKGYKGPDDYDGHLDDNFSFDVAMDARFTQNDVEQIFFNRWDKKYRTVALGATLKAVYTLDDTQANFIDMEDYKYDK
jgi:hypothetical protein